MSELEHLLQEAMKLPDAERAELAARLLATVSEVDVHKVDPDIDAAWIAEARRRSAELRTGQIQGVPWDEVEARLFSK